MAEVLQVELGERRYRITFAANINETVKRAVAELLAAGRRVAVVTDTNLKERQGAALNAMFGGSPILTMTPGEGAKSISGFAQAMEFLAANRIDRTGALFAFGGGVVGDLAGFAAAAWLRGIDLYQVPTTLLAMVDSSVGGKTGINLPAGKNLVGAFHQPRGVFVGTDFLVTLPAREFAAGMAEVIKYGLLGDAGLFGQLEQKSLTVGDSRLGAAIHRCCEMKAVIVEADERELAKEGGRALLNLGHTFGHAIEQVTAYGSYLHGEAVAIGLCAAARLSAKLGHVTPEDVARIDGVVSAHALPTRLRAPLVLRDLLGAMTRDKKVRAGLPRFVVLTSLGKAATADDIPLALVEACFCEVGAV